MLLIIRSWQRLKLTSPCPNRTNLCLGSSYLLESVVPGVRAKDWGTRQGRRKSRCKDTLLSCLLPWAPGCWLRAQSEVPHAACLRAAVRRGKQPGQGCAHRAFPGCARHVLSLFLWHPCQGSPKKQEACGTDLMCEPVGGGSGHCRGDWTKRKMKPKNRSGEKPNTGLYTLKYGV